MEDANGERAQQGQRRAVAEKVIPKNGLHFFTKPFLLASIYRKYNPQVIMPFKYDQHN